MMLNFPVKMPVVPEWIIFVRIVEAAINAGATTINIPDTVGYTLPTQFGSLIENVMNRVPEY